MSIHPPLLMRIGKRKAVPDECPVCGLGTYYPRPVNLQRILQGLSRPNFVFKQEVEGWPGYYQWWFECYHVGALAYAIGKSWEPPVELPERRLDGGDTVWNALNC